MTADAPCPARRRAGIVGAGSIGAAFAVQFASAGFRVALFDPLPEALERSRADVQSRLALLHAHGLLGEEPGEAEARVAWCDDLADAVGEVDLVQECAPERAQLKRVLFAQVAEFAPDHAVLASSSSAILPSAIGGDERFADRLIVGHPGNPPYLLPVIEVVASSATRPEVVEAAIDVYRAAGLRPVRVRREVEGFLFNRLQGALLREAYCLVRDGVASVDDIDEVVRSGLGRRWSVVGPFETVDLNTRGGLESHAEKMGPAYERMGAERGQRDPWTPELVATATAQRRALLPLDAWEERVRWRDEQLMRLTPHWNAIQR